jgi:hypothetical protein
MINTDKSYRVKFFADSTVNNILQDDEQKILILVKDKDSASVYSTFNDDFSLYLSKLPNNIMKQQVQNLVNKNLIFLSSSKVKPDNVFVRLLLTVDDKLAGVVLDTQQLNINPMLGTSESIDETVYASYFGLVRASVILNKDDVKRNKELHRLLSTYLYLLTVKAIGPDKIISPKHKDFIHMCCIYIYYKHYLKERHNYILSIIEREYSSIISKSSMDEFLPILEKMSGYDTIRDLPKILIDAKLLIESPNIFVISLIKILRPIGFYALLGPLDYFVGLVILSKYPTDLFSKKSLVNQKIQDSVEEIVAIYMDKIKYDLSLSMKS